MCGCSPKFAGITKCFDANSAEGKCRIAWQRPWPALSPDAGPNSFRGSASHVHKRQDGAGIDGLAQPGRGSELRRIQQISHPLLDRRSLTAPNDSVIVYAPTIVDLGIYR